MPTRKRAGLPAEAARLLEAAMSAAVELAEAPDRSGLIPSGSPVCRGRLHLGRVRSRLPVDGPLVVVAGFGTVAWLGAPTDPVPHVGPMAYRAETGIDRRGRVLLDRRARAWLAVEDPASFEVLVMPARSAGVLVVPVEDFARRLGEVSP